MIVRALPIRFQMNRGFELSDGVGSIALLFVEQAELVMRVGEERGFGDCALE